MAVGRESHALRIGALLLLVVLAGCSGFGVSPTVCLSCDEGLEAAASEDLGLPVSVERSELAIRVDERGDARWRVRSRLSGENLTVLASDPDRVQRLAERAVTGRRTIEGVSHPAVHDGEVRNVSATLDGRTLEITFTVPDVGRRSPGGVVLVDEFHTEGEGPPSYALGADRVLLRGPPGTVATGVPDGASVAEDGRAVVWDRGIAGDTYVAFAGDDGVVSQLATEAAVALDVAGWLSGWSIVALVGTVVLLPAGMLLARRSRTGEDPRVPPTLSERVAAVTSTSTLATAASGVLVVGTAVSLSLAAAVDAGTVRTVVYYLFTLPVVPVALFALLGVDRVRDGRRGLLLLSLAVVSLPMITPLVASLPPRPGFADLDFLLFCVSVLGALIAGTVAFLIAGRITADRSPAPNAGDRQ